MAIINLNTKEIDPNAQVPDIAIAPTQQPTQQPVSSGVIDLDTGLYVTETQATQTAQDGGASFGDKFFDIFTGELRQTEAIEGLPEIITMDLGSAFDNLKLKSALAITPNAGEKVAMIKNFFPEATFSADENGTVVGDFGGGRKGLLDAPGVTLAGAGETLLEIGAFIPAAIGVGKLTGPNSKLGRMAAQTESSITPARVAIGGAGAALTQAGLETLQQAAGGTFDQDEIAIAQTLGGAAEVVMPVINALRESRRARGIGAERQEVAKAVESIKPTTQAVEGLEQATGQNVGLFQAQQTQIPSELLKQRILPQLDAGAKTAAQALEQQNKEVFDATTSLINTIAPEGSVVSGAKRLRDTAKLSVDAKRQARSEAVKPLYKEALEVGGDVDLSGASGLIDNILNEAPLGSDFEKVGLQLKKLISPIKEGQTPTLRQLQKAKIAMQDIIDGVGEKAVSGTIKGEVAQVKRQLIASMEEASPLFKQAEDEFKRLSPAVQELEESVIGQISKLDDANLKDIAQKLFNPKAELTDPSVVRNAKKAIESVDPDAWDGILRVEMNRRIGGLEQLIEEIPGDFVGNIPGQLRRTLFGNPSQRKALLAGMNESQKKNFVYLETVLKRASSGRAAGSPTAAFGQAIEKLKGVSAVIRDVIFRPLSTLQQTGERGIFDRNVSALSKVMFDSKFKPQLKKLQKLDQNSPAAARAMTQLLNAASETDEKEQ